MIEPLNLREARAAIKPSPRAPVAELKAASPTLEAPGPLFVGQYAGFGSGSDVGFRRLSQPAGIRDLLPPVQWRMQQSAYYLFITNPLARALVLLQEAFIVGEGVTIAAEDSGVAELLDTFWNDPVNDVDESLESWVRELAIFGEQVLAVASNPINGALRIGSIDPLNVEAVEYATLAAWPGRAVAGADTVILRAMAGEASSPRMRVIAPDEDPNSPTFGQLTGDCFYVGINKARAASRGISDLFALNDWLDGYDKMLFAAMQQVDSLSRFIWDVELTGMSDNEILEWVKKNGRTPAANSVRAHNEKVKWQAIAPNLAAADKSEVLRLIKNFTLGGAGFPEHWFADGGNANRATALQQGEPTLKRLTQRQNKVKRIVSQLLNLQIDRGVAAGVLRPGVNRTVRVNMPDLSVGDINTAATAMQQAMAAMLPSMQQGLVDEKTFVEIFAALTHQLGVDLNPEDVLAKAKEEKGARDDANMQRDYARNPAAAAFGQPQKPGQQPAADPNEGGKQ